MNRADLFARWQRLTAPHENIVTPHQRQQSQLLASLMLTSMIITFLAAPILALLNPGARWAQIQMGIGLIDMLLAYLAYRMARLGDYQVAAIVFVLFGSLTIGVGALVIGSDEGLHFLYYLVLMILFASMFLPAKVVICITLLQNIMMLGFGLLDEIVTVQNIVNGPLLLNPLFAASTLLIVDHRNRLDRIHQAEMAESEVRYRTAADLATAYAFSLRVQPDGTLSPEWLTDSYFEMTGYSPDDMDPDDPLKHYHPKDHEGIIKYQQTVAGGQPCTDEFRLLAKNGTEYWIQMACQPIWDGSGRRVERIFGVVQDITERKLAEDERLEMALAQARSDLMHGFFRQVAHDFRTSLTVIETSRYMIQEYLKRGETITVTENLDTIAYQVNRLNQQIENLRVLSRLNHPGTVLCDLNAIAQAEIEQHKPAMAAKNLDCAFYASPNIPRIHAHPKELQRAIGLVLDNAIQYNTPGGSVTLRVKYEDELVQVEVSDTGIGVEQEDQGRIFEFFYRADNAMALAPDGYGLGLGIASMVTEAYGGQLTVESSPGEGSTFRMKFLIPPQS